MPERRLLRRIADRLFRGFEDPQGDIWGLTVALQKRTLVHVVGRRYLIRYGSVSEGSGVGRMTPPVACSQNCVAQSRPGLVFLSAVACRHPPSRSFALPVHSGRSTLPGRFKCRYGENRALAVRNRLVDRDWNFSTQYLDGRRDRRQRGLAVCLSYGMVLIVRLLPCAIAQKQGVENAHNVYGYPRHSDDGSLYTDRQLRA